MLRGFVRFLERRKLASAPGLAVLRAPKLPQSVPKPLTVEDAGAALAAAGDVATSVWQQKRDVAILTLLYGCGLRISEALGLTELQGILLVVIGKGRKGVTCRCCRQSTRRSPITSPPVLSLAKEGPLFVGARGMSR